MSAERIEEVLADFRRFLVELRDPSPAPPAPAQTIDLHALAGHIIALRQDVNLQTKSSRAALEQNAVLIERLSQAEECADESTDDAADPGVLKAPLKALIDVHDALSLARTQIERLREAIEPGLETAADLVAAESPPALPLESSAAPDRPAFFARLFGASRTPGNDVAGRAVLESWRTQEIERLSARSAKAHAASNFVRQTIESLITGYTMGLSRIERALAQLGMEAIPARGQRFDPETMEALEVVVSTDRPAGEVVDELRRGYLWNSRVFRFAQVRVAR